MNQATIKNYDDKDLDKDLKGLVNGGTTILECSSCGKGLIEILHTQPKDIDPRTSRPFEWQVKALCCYCGDHSYTKNIKGRFHVGGYGKIKEDDETQDIPETFPGAIYNENDVIVIETVKA